MLLFKHFILTGIFILLSNNNELNQKKIQPNLNIDVSERGIFINSIRISVNTKYSELISIIGKPNKVQKPSDLEALETKRKFGRTPFTIYTYDIYGLTIYQDRGKEGINSISVDFKNQSYNFSPLNNFSGILKINGNYIGSNTSLSQLKKISGLQISETKFRVNNSKFNNHNITFEFNSDNDKNGLIATSIDINNVLEKTNIKGWSNSDIDILNASTESSDQIKKLSKQYDFKIGDFSSCYTNKIITLFKHDEIQNPTPEQQVKILEIIKECIRESSKK